MFLCEILVNDDDIDDDVVDEEGWRRSRRAEGKRWWRRREEEDMVGGGGGIVVLSILLYGLYVTAVIINLEVILGSCRSLRESLPTCHINIPLPGHLLHHHHHDGDIQHGQFLLSPHGQVIIDRSNQPAATVLHSTLDRDFAHHQ